MAGDEYAELRKPDGEFTTAAGVEYVDADDAAEGGLAALQPHRPLAATFRTSDAATMRPTQRMK